MSMIEKIRIMTAFQQGKAIESRLNCINGQSGWTINNDPTWDWEHYEYRICENADRMTNRQLAKWLAGNNGQKQKFNDFENHEVYTYHTYMSNHDDEPVNENIVIRPWNSNKWVMPLKSMLDINLEEELI